MQPKHLSGSRLWLFLKYPIAKQRELRPKTVDVWALEAKIIKGQACSVMYGVIYEFRVHKTCYRL